MTEVTEKPISKFEIAALKRLYKNIVPQLRKVERLKQSIASLEEEKESILQSIKSTEDLMSTYTKGKNYMEVLFPTYEVVEDNIFEDTPNEDGSVDFEETVDMKALDSNEELEVTNMEFSSNWSTL